MVQDLLIYKTVAVGLWFVLWFALERLRPSAREPIGPINSGAQGGNWADTEDTPSKGRLLRWLRNGALFAINSALSPALVLPISAFAVANSLDWRPVTLDGGWLGLAFDLLILDLFIYAWHRVNHEVQLLWRFHQVHHLDRHLDTTSAVRFHFGEVLLSACARGLFVFLMDVPFSSIIVFESVVLFNAIFHHSNVRIPSGLERLLSFVVVTPSIHWVHHHAVRDDTDSNYGNLFSFWDRIFGSFSSTPRWPEMPIGVAGRTRDPSLLGLLRAPIDPL